MFRPSRATHSAVARVPLPHQIRWRSPGDCGWIGERLRDAGHARVGCDDAGAVDRGEQDAQLLPREVGVGDALRRHVAERVRAVQRRLG